MKNCTKCGNEIQDEAVVCVGCGCLAEDFSFVGDENTFEKPTVKYKNPVSYIFGILGIVFVLQLGLLFNIIGHICSLVGIVCGVAEHSEGGNISGLVLGVFSELCCIAVYILAM